jgi:hypothetical protein
MALSCSSVKGTPLLDEAGLGAGCYRAGKGFADERCPQETQLKRLNGQFLTQQRPLSNDILHNSSPSNRVKE